LTAPETRGREGAAWPAPWKAILAAGIALRALAAYPSFRSPVQSDGTMTGLTALEILHGHFRVFLFHGVRLGALESYLHVPAFLLFGATRWTLYLAPFLAGCALLAAEAFLARELLGDREGRVAFLLFAVPPPMVLLWTYLPFGYAETLLCTTVALGCAVRIGRRGASAWLVAGFGLAAGLGWWCSAQSLMGTLPAALWIVLRRPGLLRSPRLLAAGAAGFVLGALPWIAINLRYPLLSFQGGSGWQSNFAFQPASGLDQLIANGVRFIHRAASLALRQDGPRPVWLLPLVWVAGVIHLAAFGLAFFQVVVGGKASDTDGGRRVPALLLPLLIALCTAVLFIASAAGSIEGDTIRYVLPLGLAAPLALAALWGRLSRSRSQAGIAMLLVLLVVHASGYCLPGTARRERERDQARAEDHVLDRLRQRHVAWVLGGYWDVYSLNFLSGETVKAVPTWDWADYHGYGRALGRSPAPCALVSRQKGQVALWARRTGLRGELVDVDGVFEIFVPQPSPAPEEPAALIARLRDAEQPDPLPVSACRSRITLLDAPAHLVLAAGRQRTVRVRIEHAGRGGSWTSAIDLPGPVRTVRVGVRWLRDGAPAADQRVELPRSLAPGETAEVEVPLTARGADGRLLPPGRYEVRIGMVQELVRWFAETGDTEMSIQVDVKE